MAKEFKNGAVVMNDENMFLCTTNGRDLFWENSTENAICFKDNKDAEDFLNRWNRNNPNAILNGVRITASNCQCGEERRPVGTTSTRTNNVTVTPEILALAVSALKGHMSDFAKVAEAANKLAELEEEKAEIEESLKEVNAEIKEIKDSMKATKREIDGILGRVLSPQMVEAVKAELFGK